jgi:HD-like signal output (HDOD) protein
MSIELVLLGQLLNLAGDPDCSLESFGEQVATSPHLAVEVVRVSNSALYGMEGKINRLERAVLILGMRTVADIASAVLVAKEMKGMNVGSLSGDSLWMHSLETGVCAQLIARCLSLPLESEAYLAGLLHDLGILELYEDKGEPYAETIVTAQKEERSLIEVERETFGEDHCSRLLTVSAGWGFPSLLCEAIGYHDCPLEAPEASRTLAALVRAAHIVIDEPSEGWSDVPKTDEDEALLELLDLEPQDVEDIQAMQIDRMKEVAPLFRLSSSAALHSRAPCNEPTTSAFGTCGPCFLRASSWRNCHWETRLPR